LAAEIAATKELLDDELRAEIIALICEVEREEEDELETVSDTTMAYETLLADTVTSEALEMTPVL